jgi:hypothetical protein
MAWRTFAIVLLAMNIAAFAYAWLSPQQAARPWPATDPQTPGLVLLSERDQAQMQLAAQSAGLANGASEIANSADGSDSSPVAAVAADSADTASIAPAPEFCERVGPIANEADANSFRARLGAVVARAELSSEQSTQVRGLWVYLGGLKDRESALARARQLSAAGIRDYYVVTEGEAENSISLGMFRDASNADKRIAQLAALGFKAQRVERGETVKQFWIRYRAASQSKSQIGAMRGMANLQRQTIFCNELSGPG